MKNNFLLILIGAFVITQLGCTKDFKDLNTDPYALTLDQLAANNASVSAFFSVAQQNLVENGPWLTQLDNFYGDNFVGYVHPPSAFRETIIPALFLTRTDGRMDYGEMRMTMS